LRGWFAPLLLAAARARRRPARWLLPMLGIALAAAFGAGVAAESQIAGDQSARLVLGRTSPLATEVRVTWQGAITPGVADQARALLRELGLGPQTEVVLMNPVRLGGVVVRPVAIAPLGPWLPGTAPGRLGPCRPERCPMLLAGNPGDAPIPPVLAAIGVRIQVVGSAPLHSAVPLGFVPSDAGAAPVLVTTDVAGLESLPGLSGLYRTYSWLAPLPIARLHGWQLAGAENRLARSQARLVLAGSQFSLSAPFTTLDEARAEASAVPQRLLLAGGGAIVALALFVVLAGGGLRRDQRAELVRLRYAGARTHHCLLFVIAESGWLCAGALSVGAAAGIGAAALLARAEGEPAGAILTHGLITPAGAIALGAGWLAATALLTTLVLVQSARLIDLLAVAAAAALVAALAGGTGSDHALALLLAPLCCVAVGVLTFRAAGLVLRGAERVARGGPVLARLALVNLARSPWLPALAIAFLAVAVGLGGFALAYRSTLIRSAADQAADRVPLDALVAPGPDFRTPLELAPLQRWQALAAGPVLPIRRTEANYDSGGGTVTVPALGVPAGGLIQIHGWRPSDGSAPLAVLARRIAPTGPGARADASGRRALAVAARLLARLRGRRARRPARPAGNDPAGGLRDSRRWRCVPACRRAERTVGAGGSGAGRTDRRRDYERSSERREPGRRHSVSLARYARAAARAASPRRSAAARTARRLAWGRRGDRVRAGWCRRAGQLRRERNTRRAPAGTASRHAPGPGARRPAYCRLRRAWRADRPDGRRPPGDRARGRGPQPLPGASLRPGRLRHRRRADAGGGPGCPAPRSGPGG
jgi:hypothetical protein